MQYLKKKKKGSRCKSKMKCGIKSCLVWLPFSPNCVTLNVNKLHPSMREKLQQRQKYCKKPLSWSFLGKRTALHRFMLTKPQTIKVTTYGSDSQTSPHHRVLPWNIHSLTKLNSCKICILHVQHLSLHLDTRFTWLICTFTVFHNSFPFWKKRS